MPTLELGYGPGAVKFDYDSARFEVLAPDAGEAHPLTDAEIGAALEAPIDSRLLEDRVAAGDSVLIVASDATRATGSPQIINLLVRRLIQNGIAPGDIAIIFATGIHRPVRQAEKVELLSPFIAQRIRTIDHDAYDASQLIQIGIDANGATVEVNRALKEFSKVILTGAVSFHYFAGFTGGRKAICPGLASAETIKATHMLALDFERGGRRAGVGAGSLSGNAVNEACEHVATMIDPAFMVNAIVDDRGRVEQVFAGGWRAAHARACEVYASSHTQLIPEKRELVIVSCGGSPYDINMIQAHKALDMATWALKDGGDLVLLARCQEGTGRDDFLRWFEKPSSVAIAERLRSNYQVSGQTAWALASKTERYRITLVSQLPDDAVRQMGMRPAPDLASALASLPESSGYLIPHAAEVIPVIV